MFAKIVFSSDAQGGVDITIEMDAVREVAASCDKMAAWCLSLARSLSTESAESGMFADPEGCTSPASIMFGDTLLVDFGDGIKDGQPMSLAQHLACIVMDNLLGMTGSGEQRADA